MCGSSSGPAPPSGPSTLWLPVSSTTQQSHEKKWIISFIETPGITPSYPYLCYQLHLGILDLPLQGVDLVSLRQDLNDEFILKRKCVYFHIPDILRTGAVRKCGLNLCTLTEALPRCLCFPLWSLACSCCRSLL